MRDLIGDHRAADARVVGPAVHPFLEERAVDDQLRAPVEQVDEAARPTSVRWTVTECTFEPDWVGTRPTFSIVPVDGDASELTFRHVGLTSVLECIDMCTRGWDHYLASLRAYVETGRGNPRGSEADQARRAADADPR
jgi:hypothetical protein